MTLATLHLDEGNQYQTVQVRLLTIPRIGETLTVPVLGVERDLRVTELNHLFQFENGCVQFVELVIFTSLR